MSGLDELTKARKVARGIGGFLLFFAVYALAGSLAGALIVYSLASKIFGAPPSDGSALDNFLNLSAAVLVGFLGVILGASVLSKTMKDYPARGIGVAFVTWLLANYLLHFIFFPHSHIPDFEVYTGLLQSLIAAATAWYTFRLPPFRLRNASAKVDPKPVPNLFEVGRRLAIALMDPDDCWRDVCCLRAYKAPGPVATCEMAFARAAIVKDAIRRCQSGSIAAEMLAGVDKVVAEAFANEDSQETLAYYKKQRLSDVAHQAVRFYERNVFPLTQLDDVFGHRLSVPGWPAADITPLFQDVATEAERLMKISSSRQKVAL